MSASVFLSHSFSDGTSAATKLEKYLSKTMNVSVMAPTRAMRLGYNWREQAYRMISQTDAVLFLLTKKSFEIDTACRMECLLAQRIGKPVIPLRMDKIEIYPVFILPSIIMVDFTKDFDKGLKRLGLEVDNIHALGTQHNPIPESTWQIGDGELFREHQELFLGEWLVTRRPIPGEKFAFIPKYELFLRETGRFRERVNSPVARLLRVEGMWTFHAEQSHLLLVQNAELQRIMAISEHLGPNRFGGTMENRRYKAERLLEFR